VAEASPGDGRPFALQLFLVDSSGSRGQIEDDLLEPQEAQEAHTDDDPLELGWLKRLKRLTQRMIPLRRVVGR
jgi:hypothetical protein